MEEEKFKQFRRCLINDMKKLDLWSLNEGIALITYPWYFDRTSDEGWITFDQEILYELNIRIFTDAIEAGILKVYGLDKKKIDNWEPDPELPFQVLRKVDFWNNCYALLKVNPFELLEFIKKKELYTIPSELDYVKNISESGEIQYYWLSEKEKGAFTIANQTPLECITNENKIEKHVKLEDHQHELEEFILKIIPEIEKFNKWLVEYYKRTNDNNLANADNHKLRNAGITFFDNNESEFSYLKRDYIEAESIYCIEQRRRGMIGKILRAMVVTELPHLLADKKINISLQSLYNLYRRLKKID